MSKSSHECRQHWLAIEVGAVGLGPPQGRHQQKKVAENQAQAQLRDAQSKVLMDVNSRFRKLEESRMLIAVAQAEREASQQKLREVTSQYEQQAVLLRDVMQQQAATAGALDDYRQALLGFWTAKTNFEKSLGEDQ